MAHEQSDKRRLLRRQPHLAERTSEDPAPHVQLKIARSDRRRRLPASG